MRVVGIGVRILVATGLAIDAYVHAALADVYDIPAGGAITQGELFLIEAGVASLAALLVLVWPSRTSFGFAFLVAASALGAALLYRYVQVGSLGPLPRMYTPLWTYEKVLSAVAEGVAAVLAVVGFVLYRPHRKRDNREEDNSDVEKGH